MSEQTLTYERILEQFDKADRRIKTINAKRARKSKV